MVQAARKVPSAKAEDTAVARITATVTARRAAMGVGCVGGTERFVSWEQVAEWERLGELEKGGEFVRGEGEKLGRGNCLIAG